MYQEHLNRVSRSFAKSIQMLNEPLRQYVALSYLLCRIIDTIEDEESIDSHVQSRAFQQLKVAMQEPQRTAQFLATLNHVTWAKPEEALLINDTQLLLKDLNTLPIHVQKHILSLCNKMMDGMWHFLNQSKEGKIKIASNRDLNMYCYFVAGVVGECLTKIVGEVEGKWLQTKGLMKKSHNFGLFLQKINILKDQNKDEKEGRYFVPDRKEVYINLLAHAKDSLDYIRSIPMEQKAYKVFCLSAFLLGIQTMKKMDPNKVSANPKVSRVKMMEIFMRLDQLASSNLLLEKYVSDVLPEVLESTHQASIDYKRVAEVLG